MTDASEDELGRITKWLDPEERIYTQYGYIKQSRWLQRELDRLSDIAPGCEIRHPTPDDLVPHLAGKVLVAPKPTDMALFRPGAERFYQKRWGE